MYVARIKNLIYQFIMFIMFIKQFIMFIKQILKIQTIAIKILFIFN